MLIIKSLKLLWNKNQNCFTNNLIAYNWAKKLVKPRYLNKGKWYNIDLTDLVQNVVFYHALKGNWILEHRI